MTARPQLKPQHWLPNGNGWLLFGQVVVDRDGGNVVGDLRRDRGAEGPADRVFRGAADATDLGGTPRELRSVPLPK